MRYLIYRDENPEAIAAGDKAIEGLDPKFKDTLGFRNARRFNNQTERADVVLVVGDYPDIVKAYKDLEWEKLTIKKVKLAAPKKPKEPEPKEPEAKASDKQEKAKDPK